jgi:hypothetical protein
MVYDKVNPYQVLINRYPTVEHDEYHTQYPWEIGSGKVVNKLDFPEFTAMLQEELDNVKSDEFDFAQQMFDQYGATAPILDLYNRYYDKK